ncbi:MAG: aminoacyl-tRNA hydrolase [Chloroflexi bacterium]|nr:aminoacyl-tRNA hydrolase [Chloroflexota bacterium]
MHRGDLHQQPGESQPEVIVVGLGNPGTAYAQHRHNAGFQVVDRLAKRAEISLTERRARSLIAAVSILGHMVLLAQPQTWMNESGKAVKALLERYRLPPAHTMLIYDDLDLPLGRVRIRPQGAPGGHHGLESIFKETGSQDFPRVRIGIGRPARREEVIDFVLSPFTPNELRIMEPAWQRAIQAVDLWLSSGIGVVMNTINGASASPEDALQPQQYKENSMRDNA